MLCEAGEINDTELAFLHEGGWETVRIRAQSRNRSLGRLQDPIRLGPR